jgi:hypothetical protein
MNLVSESIVQELGVLRVINEITSDPCSRMVAVNAAHAISPITNLWTAEATYYVGAIIWEQCIDGEYVLGCAPDGGPPCVVTVVALPNRVYCIELEPFRYKAYQLENDYAYVNQQKTFTDYFCISGLTVDYELVSISLENGSISEIPTKRGAEFDEWLVCYGRAGVIGSYCDGVFRVSRRDIVIADFPCNMTIRANSEAIGNFMVVSGDMVYGFVPRGDVVEVLAPSRIGVAVVQMIGRTVLCEDGSIRSLKTGGNTVIDQIAVVDYPSKPKKPAY